jgi:hypothetical protein
LFRLNFDEVSRYPACLLSQFALAATLASGGTYSIVGGYTCEAPGLLRQLETMDKNEKWSESFKRNYLTANCMPRIATATHADKVNVIAFQGEYAFVCQFHNPKVFGAEYDLPYYRCTYAMTKHLRDGNGQTPPSQVSKTSPSPSFFNNARKLDFSGVE